MSIQPVFQYRIKLSTCILVHSVILLTRLGKAETVATLRQHVQFGRDTAGTKCLIVKKRMPHRYTRIILAADEQSLRRTDAYLPLHRIILPLAGIVTREPLTTPAMGAGTESDYGIEKDGEIRSGNVIHPQVRRCRGKMTTRGKSCNADFAHAPFRGVMAAVTECVLNIPQRKFVILSERCTVQDYTTGDSAFEAPLREPYSFLLVVTALISATRTAHYHLPVAFLRKVKVNLGVIPYSVPTVGRRMGALLAAVVLKGAESHRHPVLHYSLVNALPFRVKHQDLRGLGKISGR